jgi:hypothetical protein
VIEPGARYSFAVPRAEELIDLLAARVPPERRAWAVGISGFEGREGALRLFSAASRKLGREPLGGDSGWAAWAVDEVARLALLVAICERWPADAPATVAEIYRTGDLREKLAVIRSLAHLPDAARFAPIAELAVRADAFAVFQALALDNVFPARHLGELSFNQMIMKAAMNGLPLGRVVDLASRRTLELARMARAFESERRAAGRPVPGDLNLVT